MIFSVKKAEIRNDIENNLHIYFGKESQQATKEEMSEAIRSTYQEYARFLKVQEFRKMIPDYLLIAGVKIDKKVKMIDRIYVAKQIALIEKTKTRDFKNIEFLKTNEQREEFRQTQIDDCLYRIGTNAGIIKPKIKPLDMTEFERKIIERFIRKFQKKHHIEIKLAIKKCF